MGFTIEPGMIVRDDVEGFDVWEENWPSLCAFLSVETQWDFRAVGTTIIWKGLDYSGVDAAMRRLKLPDETFADIQEMEGAALAVFSESHQ